MSSREYCLWMQSGQRLIRGSLSGFLNLRAGTKGVVSFVGGGGKTTTIFRLAGELSELPARAKQKVLVTTTTKMRLPENGCFLPEPEPEDLEGALLREPFVVIGRALAPKMTMVEEGLFSKALGLADFALLEADGARGLSMKAPAEHEPVLAAQTTALVALMGADCIGRPIGAACHRPERVCRILGREPGHCLSPEDAAFLLLHPLGQKKGCKELPGYMEDAFYIIINKIDDGDRLMLGKRILEELGKRGCQKAALTGAPEGGRYEGID